MGYLTPILIRNDALNTIQEHSEEFVQGIKNKMDNGGELPLGNYCNPVEIFKTEHMDIPRVFIVNGNTMFEVKSNLKNKEFAKDFYKQSIKIAKQIIKDCERELK
jgi:hypothetical protein